MDCFGEIWVDHTSKINGNWKKYVSHDDIVMIGGDISWGNQLETVLPDLVTLSELPGIKKIMVKGNHDYWWRKAEKIKNKIPANLVMLEGNAVKHHEMAFCGTRGWLAPNDPYFTAIDQKTYNKELKLLDQALQEAVKLKPKEGIHLLMHFAPFTSRGETTSFFDLIRSYPVSTLSFGHFHKKEEWETTPTGKIDHIDCFLTSTDYLGHKPQMIWKTD